MIPLIVKGAAIHRLMGAAKRLRRVVLKRKQLFGVVLLLSGTVVVFLIVWTTAMDPPRKQAEYEISDVLTDQSETVVFPTYFCSSDSNGWVYASVGWHLLMLVIATVQTIQTRAIRREINESQILAVFIYSHIIFACLRIVTLFLNDSSSMSHMMLARSIIYSLDCTAAIIIYFMPKFVAARDESNDAVPMDSSHAAMGEAGKEQRCGLESQTVRQLRRLAAVATAQYEREQNENRRVQDRAGGVAIREASTRRSSLTAKDLEETFSRIIPAFAESVAALGIDPDSLMKSMDTGEIIIDEDDDSGSGEDLFLPLRQAPRETPALPSTLTVDDEESSGEVK